LDCGVERAVLDLAWGEEAVTRQAQFVERAGEVGEGRSLRFVEVGLKPLTWFSLNERPMPDKVVLGISMWRSDHPCGLLSRIELDARRDRWARHANRC
jgi:hypothetical protein